MTTIQNLDELLAGLEAEKQTGLSARAARIAQRVPFSITHVATDPVTGEQRDFTRHYMEQPSDRPGYEAEVLDVRHDGTVSENWSVSVGSLDQYKGELMAKAVKEGEKWVRDNAFMRAQSAAVARYVAELRPLLIARGFKDNGDPMQEHGDRFLLAVFDGMVEHDHERYDDLAAYMTAPYKTDGAFRKAMRELVTAGKENARDEYPEAYREEDDKDDFYDEYMNEVLTGAFFPL